MSEKWSSAKLCEDGRGKCTVSWKKRVKFYTSCVAVCITYVDCSRSIELLVIEYLILLLYNFVII